MQSWLGLKSPDKPTRLAGELYRWVFAWLPSPNTPQTEQRPYMEETLSGLFAC
jgi:hypothetical protein